MQCKISKWKKDSRRWILEMNSTDSYIFLKVSDYIVGLILGYKSCSFTTLITGSSRCVCTKPSCLWADSNWGVGAIAAATGTDLLAPRASHPQGEDNKGHPVNVHKPYLSSPHTACTLWVNNKKWTNSILQHKYCTIIKLQKIHCIPLNIVKVEFSMGLNLSTLAVLY